MRRAPDVINIVFPPWFDWRACIFTIFPEFISTTSMIGKVIVMPELMKRKRYSTKKEKNEKEEITTMRSKLV